VPTDKSATMVAAACPTYPDKNLGRNPTHTNPDFLSSFELQVSPGPCPETGVALLHPHPESL
jgi:hypothetical protein